MQVPDRKKLIVITGPTASGKSALAIELAIKLNTEIISADSRQIYAGLPVTTAAPDDADLARVRHHLVGVLPLQSPYSAARFRDDATRIAAPLLERSGSAIVCGGSMMYIDALCDGIDDLPDVDESLRSSLAHEVMTRGTDWLLNQLRELDPAYYERVDRRNIKRVFHAVELSIMAGRPYSSMLTGKKTPPDLDCDIIRIALRMPRERLFERIEARVGVMARAGMIEEVRAVSNLRHLNSLNTVGVKEILKYIDGEWTLDFALARLAKNTRVYAKKQMTWLQRKPEVIYLDVKADDTPASLCQKALGIIQTATI